MKTESIQKRCIRLVLNDYESDYATLLKKKNTTILEIKRLLTLAIETCKNISNINPSFMKDTFTLKGDLETKPYEINVKHHKSANYNEKSLIASGPKM